ncbi:MAG: DUF72 domain-containing protein [Bryobacteraceae bacterium]|nr:DUF72 domain-containing protein [Bryobacteraceae bacterium]
MSNLSLFDPPASSFRDELAEKLRRLAQEGVWIGASSWKYEGWFGQIYTRERYFTGRRFSKRSFEDTCLAEYAETFSIVGGDFSFYQFPSEPYWRKLFGSAPPTLRFAFKVPEEITVKAFPSHARYGPRAGQVNESFLNAETLERLFLEPLRPWRNQVAALILEFGAFSRQMYERVEQFTPDLGRFLDALPRDFRYAVEIRNAEFLDDAYFDCLRARNVAHVFNAWTRMPELEVQISLRQAYTADFTLTRALLRRGRTYEQAVKMFEPYDRIQEENPSGRHALRDLIRGAREAGQPAFIFVNNRFEGNAPHTIQAALED